MRSLRSTLSSRWILGFRSRSDIGLDDPSHNDLTVVAEAACDEEETIHNQPFAVSSSMVRDALLTADELSRRVRENR